MRVKLTGTFDSSKGKFRALLQAVVARRVVDHLRKVKAEPLAPAMEAELQAPATHEWDALDLEAALIEAVGACRDELSGGPSKDLPVLHTLTDRLVHGMTATEIAKRDGISRDRVSRLLTKGRDAIFRHLLASELGAGASDERVAASVTAFKRMLRRPTQAHDHLAALEDTALSEQLGEFWARFRSSLPRFEGDLTAAGRELAHGVELILGSEGP
ncbi:MAG: sigma-70 family RNA polymerase sigma factor [Planctomycetes bacterium]|nr:sigma-70 family RNA polymerase sigma factor [Planctomycetota bacterium]